MSRYKWLIALAIVVLPLSFWACDNAGTPGPSPVEEPVAVQTAPATPATPTPPAQATPEPTPQALAACEDQYTAVPLNFDNMTTVPNGATLRVRFDRKNVPSDHPVHVAWFDETGGKKPGEQDLVDKKVKTFSNSNELFFNHIQLPDDDECREFQIDAGCGDKIPDGGNYGIDARGMFNKAWHVRTDKCVPPPPTPTPPPCADSFLSHNAVTDDCSVCINVNSSHPGTGTVSDGESVVHSWEFPAGESQECSGEIEEGGSFTYNLKTECDDGRGKFAVECEDSCDNYDPPPFGGSLDRELTKNKATFDVGTTPQACVWDPSLPKTYNRPDYGDPTKHVSFTCTQSYGPPELECEASGKYPGKVPPKKPTCEDLNPPYNTYKMTSGSVKPHHYHGSTPHGVKANVTVLLKNGTYEVRLKAKQGQTWTKDRKRVTVSCEAGAKSVSLGYSSSHSHTNTEEWWVEIDPQAGGYPTEKTDIPRTGY